MDKARTQFVCRQCGREVAKWLGRCPGCGGWNTLEAHSLTAGAATPQEIASLGTAAVSRMSLSYTEVNRVLGGGLVPGSLVLLAGEPGIGKST
ncbi:MAG: DNA repair protein RadA, partial [Dehalococcoidia bacterium]|nr:DNA repair protein RadA [Dehalococcoidia bacterium]